MKKPSEVTMTTISTDKARQGRWGNHVLYILIASLILAVLVWIGLEMYGESIDAPTATENAEQAPAPSPASPPADKTP